MTTQTLVRLSGDRLVTTSLEISNHFGKKHKDILRAIQHLECSREFNERNFAPVGYLDAKGERRPMYEITRDGFVFLCMGFTGSAAAQWKEKYIAAFNALEAEVARRNAPDARMLQQLQAAYLETHPDAAKVLRYYQMGLNQHEIGRLMGYSADTVHARLRRLALVGLTDYAASDKMVEAGRKGIRARREKAAFAALQLSLPVGA